MMEQYTVNRLNVESSITEGKFFNHIHHKHIESYGETGAKNIVQNVRVTYSKLMKQIHTNQQGNHWLLIMAIIF